MISPMLTDITQNCSPGGFQALWKMGTGGRSGEHQAGGSGWALSPLSDSGFPRSQIIRVQSPEGVKRITATKRETVATFLKKVPQGPQCLPRGWGRAPVTLSCGRSMFNPPGSSEGQHSMWENTL